MWPHTCSRLSEPDAKRLKYSEPRNGLWASSSAVSASYHSSVVIGHPPSRGLTDCDGIRTRLSQHPRLFERLTDLGAVLHEALGVLHVPPAGTLEVDVDDPQNAAGTRRHHDH